MKRNRKFFFAGAGLALTATAALAATHYNVPPPAAPLAAYVPGGSRAMDMEFLTPEPTAYVTPHAMFFSMDQMAAAMDQQMMQAIADNDDMAPDMDSAGRDPLEDAVLQGPSDDADANAPLDVALRNGNTCVQTVSITERAGEKPQMVARTYGNCGAASSAAPASQTAAPAVSAPQPGLIEASLVTSAHKHKKHPA